MLDTGLRFSLHCHGNIQWEFSKKKKEMHSFNTVSFSTGVERQLICGDMLKAQQEGEASESRKKKREWERSLLCLLSWGDKIFSLFKV